MEDAKGLEMQNPSETLLLLGGELALSCQEIALLESAGYRVVRAASEEQAREEARRARPDLWLVDLEPGREDEGLRMARRLARELPVALFFRVDPLATGELLHQAEELNPCGYVPRGVGRALLLVALRRGKKVNRARRREEGSFQKDVLGDAVFFRRSLSGVCLVELETDHEGRWVDGRFLDVNASFERQTGLKRETLLGRRASEALAGVGWEVLLESFASVTSEETPLRCEQFFSGTGRYFLVTAYPVEPRSLVMVCDDITDRKMREQELARSHLRLESVLRSTGAGSWEWNVQTGETVYNEAWAAMLGYTLQELGPTTHETWKKLVHPKDAPASSRLLARHVAGELPYYDCQYRMRHRDGHWVWIHDRGQVATRTEDGKPLMVYGTHMDISAIKKAEDALREMKNLHEGIVRTMSDGVMLTDDQGRVVFVNREFAALLGEPPKALLGRNWIEFVLPAQRSVAEAADLRRKQGLSDRYELVLQRRDGTRRAVLVGGCARHDKSTGKFLGTMGIFTDITERQRAEKEIRKLLGEKDLILQEAHHRMKNHMNTMCSILSLHAQTLEDPKAVRALADARSRLESMAMLYEMLYRRGAPQAMSLGSYLPELVRSVVALFPQGPHVQVEIAVDEVILSSRTLSALGILVNELVSNAMKYAFAGRTGGVLRITARQEKGQVYLAVEDDGPGFPLTIDLDRPSGFGLRLVTLLATQLEGTLAVRSGQGARISLDFPVS